MCIDNLRRFFRNNCEEFRSLHFSVEANGILIRGEMHFEHIEREAIMNMIACLGDEFIVERQPFLGSLEYDIRLNSRG